VHGTTAVELLCKVPKVDEQAEVTLAGVPFLFAMDDAESFLEDIKVDEAPEGTPASVP